MPPTVLGPVAPARSARPSKTGWLVRAPHLDPGRTLTAWVHGFVSMELGGDLERAYAYGIDRLADALAGQRPATA